VHVHDVAPPVADLGAAPGPQWPPDQTMHEPQEASQ
jgi:hypothetical protein